MALGRPVHSPYAVGRPAPPDLVRIAARDEVERRVRRARRRGRFAILFWLFFLIVLSSAVVSLVHAFGAAAGLSAGTTALLTIVAVLGSILLLLVPIEVFHRQRRAADADLKAFETAR